MADLDYDVDRGTYDLSIRAEGDAEPLVVLHDQANAIGLPGSRLHKFSFIGDPPGRDTSNAVFWSGEMGQALVRELRGAFPAEWSGYVATALVAEHRYYVLLWQERVDEALDYAVRMVRRYRALDLPGMARRRRFR